MIARFASRVVAVALWWAAVWAATYVWRDQSDMGQIVGWAAVVLLASAGAAAWKGGDEC